MGSRGSRRIEVLDGGLEATIQDYPGRPGLLSQGFSPAGLMDYFAFRAANLLVGNDPAASGLEVTLGNAALRVHADTTLAVCGAHADATVDGEPVSLWESFVASAGSELRIGIAPGPGFRLDVPVLGGSCSTYTMGQLGGFEGRAFRAGDQIPLGLAPPGAATRRRRFAQSARPAYSRDWEVEVLRGPQASPDFLTEGDMEALLGRAWRVDVNSNRTGIRLEPHAFEGARDGGGVAGGFICAATVAQAAFWKSGQMRPVGDTVRFREVTLAQARALDADVRQRLSAASVTNISQEDVSQGDEQSQV